MDGAKSSFSLAISRRSRLIRPKMENIKLIRFIVVYPQASAANRTVFNWRNDQLSYCLPILPSIRSQAHTHTPIGSVCITQAQNGTPTRVHIGARARSHSQPTTNDVQQQTSEQSVHGAHLPAIRTQLQHI